VADCTEGATTAAMQMLVVQGRCPMVHLAATIPFGQPMSWEQFLEIPDDERAEYVDGKAFVSPPPSFAHQEICQRLRDVLKAQLGAGAIVAVGVGWRLPGERPRLRIPDAMVLTEAPSGDVVTTAPTVVIEVLSTNRTDDLVRKSTEYLGAGVRQYWIVDPRDRVLDVFELAASGWERIAQLSDDAPTATVTIPLYGAIELSLECILG